jgi:hypothetical protein
MVWKGSMVLASLSIRPCPSTTPKCEAEIIMDQEYMCSVKLEPWCVVLLRVTFWTKIVENEVALGGCSLFCVLQWTMNLSVTVDTSCY